MPPVTTGPQAAVLNLLTERGPLNVPEIAAALGISEAIARNIVSSYKQRGKVCSLKTVKGAHHLHALYGVAGTEAELLARQARLIEERNRQIVRIVRREEPPEPIVRFRVPVPALIESAGILTHAMQSRTDLERAWQAL